MLPFHFDAAIGGRSYFNTTEAALVALGFPAAEVAAAVAAATARAVEAEMRGRIDLVWAGKRPSAQSYWTALVAKGAAATVEEAADAAALAAGDAWEAAMLVAAKALAGAGDAAAAVWPAPPAAFVALLAEPFAL